MKKIIAALIALSALTGVAASANAFDARSFYEDLDRSRTYDRHHRQYEWSRCRGVERPDAIDAGDQGRKQPCR